MMCVVFLDEYRSHVYRFVEEQKLDRCLIGLFDFIFMLSLLIHYQQILNHAPAAQCPALDDAAANAVPTDDVCEDAPTLEEVQRAIRKTQKQSSCRSKWNHPQNFWKLLRYQLAWLFIDCFCSCGSLERFPDWKEAVIISLCKGKGSQTICSSYRPISLLLVPGMDRKVFAHEFLERLQPLLTHQQRPQQSCFTHCRSTIDAILALRLLAEQHREFRKPLHVAYIDFKAAFEPFCWKARLCRTPDSLLSMHRLLPKISQPGGPTAGYAQQWLPVSEWVSKRSTIQSFGLLFNAADIPFCLKNIDTLSSYKNPGSN